jgi:hypothetical protein
LAVIVSWEGERKPGVDLFFIINFATGHTGRGWWSNRDMKKRETLLGNLIGLVSDRFDI